MKAPAVRARASRQILRGTIYGCPADALQIELPFCAPPRPDPILAARAVVDRHRRVTSYLEGLRLDPQARSWGGLRREAEILADRDPAA